MQKCQLDLDHSAVINSHAPEGAPAAPEEMTLEKTTTGSELPAATSSSWVIKTRKLLPSQKCLATMPPDPVGTR